VFLSEGIQKFLYAEDRRQGVSPRSGSLLQRSSPVELIGDALILLGLSTRLAAIPLIIDMGVAIVTTKLPILLGHDLGPFQLRSLERYGFWSMAHEMPTDWAMLCGCLFLLIVGSGRWSMDYLLTRSAADREGGMRTSQA
jgi:uncharacterized membrane protein YphA (DoxX/SURF4 family)